MANKLICFEVDEDDDRAINEAFAKMQQLNQPFGGSDALPEGESDLRGAMLGEICRGWIELMAML